MLIAALCPHLQSGMALCEKQAAEAPMSHEDMGHMGHMEMEPVSQPEPASQPNSHAFALGQPIGPCSHCAVHSRTTPSTVSLRETEAAKRPVALNLPLGFSRFAPVIVSPIPVLTSRAHGPPGEAVLRHVLINIFRI